MDERGGRRALGAVLGQQARVPQALTVPGTLAHLGRGLLLHRPLLAPPGATPPRVRAGEMNVHAVKVAVTIGVELRKVKSLIKRIERFHEQRVDIALIIASLVLSLIIHSGARYVQLAVACAPIVRMQAFVREARPVAAVEQRIERFKRIVVGEGIVRERHAQRQHVSGADRGHAAFPSRRDRGSHRGRAGIRVESCRLPCKGLLRQVSGQLRMAEALGNLRTLVERTIRTVAFDLLLGRNARRTLVSGSDGVDAKRRSRRGCERKGQCDNRKCPGSDDLNLMRKGINDRRLIAHAVPFLREGPVIRLPVFAVKKRESETGTEMRSPRTGDGSAFAHRRHCANRRR